MSLMNAPVAAFLVLTAGVARCWDPLLEWLLAREVGEPGEGGPLWASGLPPGVMMLLSFLPVSTDRVSAGSQTQRIGGCQARVYSL